MFNHGRKIILGNWKMNQNLAETKIFFSEVMAFEGITQGICPQFPYMQTIQELKPASSSFHIGSQNISANLSGAFTGDTSISSVMDFGGSFTLVGHSERRQIFHENPEEMVSKINLAMGKNLGVVFCIGETLEERESGRVVEVLEEQIASVLPKVENLNPELICIAYEPVCSHRTGVTATSQQASDTHREIESILKKALPENFWGTPILYGGSVKPSNAKELLENKEISGALIGGASLKAGDFNSISEIASKL